MSKIRCPRTNCLGTNVRREMPIKNRPARQYTPAKRQTRYLRKKRCRRNRSDVYRRDLVLTSRVAAKPIGEGGTFGLDRPTGTRHKKSRCAPTQYDGRKSGA